MLNDAASSKISLMEEPQVSVAVNNNLLEVFFKLLLNFKGQSDLTYSTPN